MYVNLCLFQKSSIVIVYNLDPLGSLFFLWKQNYVFHVQYPLQYRTGKKTISKPVSQNQIILKVGNFTCKRKEISIPEVFFPVQSICEEP